MNFQIDLNQFIKDHVIERQVSLFANDIDNNKIELIRKLEAKRVLVIGVAGTIGSSFIKSLLPYKPSSLTVVDYSENGLTELTRDLRSSDYIVPSEYLTYAMDFGSDLFTKFFLRNKYDVIACFAAHKHVRSEKDIFSIEAMINNNIFNAQKLLELALINKPQHLFFVSTDKATNPVNVMGVSKAILEKLIFSYCDELNITMARFANVAFSNGSLLDGFVNRINKLQPLSGPNDIYRYFVSPEESGQICLLSCMKGNPGDIFFPKLPTESMKSFSDIGIAFLKTLGLDPTHYSTEKDVKACDVNLLLTSNKYPVYFSSSSTSGEKKEEEFYDATDEISWNKYGSLAVINASKTSGRFEIEHFINKLRELLDSDDLSKNDIVEYFSTIIDSFQHKEMEKNLDSGM